MPREEREWNHIKYLTKAREDRKNGENEIEKNEQVQQIENNCEEGRYWFSYSNNYFKCDCFEYN